jgi:HAMP domain-containing protein
MGTNRRQLRLLLLNTSYQLKFVILAAGSSFLLAATNAAIFYHFAQDNYAMLINMSPMTPDAKEQIYHGLHQMVLLLSAFTILFTLIVAGVALRLSHRTAGPLYRFQRVFNDIRDGKIDCRVTLRPLDDFQEVALAFNQMMDKLTAPRASSEK